MGLTPFEFFNIPPWLLFILIVWSLVWKGMALWKSARQKQKNWFIVILVVNTVGILEIIYLCCFAKKAKAKNES